jgi:hypothetical protein
MTHAYTGASCSIAARPRLGLNSLTLTTATRAAGPRPNVIRPVDARATDLFLTDPRDTRRLVDREVRLVGAVDDEVVDPPAADLHELPLPRSDERAEDGLARGAQKRAAPAAREQQAVRQVQRLAEPVHDHHLHFRGGRRGGPGEGHGVDAGGERLAEGAHGAA